MIWRLISIPIILSILLMSLILSVASLSHRQTVQYQKYQSQKLELLSTKVEKALYELNFELNERYKIYEKAHLQAQSVLENNPNYPLNELKKSLENKLGFEADVFLINDDHKVIHATFEPDLGLDFNNPVLAETLIAFERAKLTEQVVIGHPTLEIVTNEYKIYTLSHSECCGFIQLGFVDPIIGGIFSNTIADIRKITDVDSADLFSVVADADDIADGIINFNPITANEAFSNLVGSKKESMQLRDSLLMEETVFFDQAFSNGRISINDPNDQTKKLVYLSFNVPTPSTDIPVKYLAKIKLVDSNLTWYERNFVLVNIVLTILIISLLVLLFVEVRFRIVLPLRKFTRALEHDKEIEIKNNSIPKELLHLVQSFNTYRYKSDELKKQLRQSAITDPLTGVYNRGALDSIFEMLIALSRRENQLFALAFIDLDHFKEYNDFYGHQLGDKALQILTEVIKDTFRRPTDACIRFGGEEFIVIFTCESTDEAVKQVTRLQKQLQSKNIRHEKSRIADYLTFSLGLTVVDPNKHEALQQIIRVADEALYEAKTQGRNRIVLNYL